MNILHVYRTYFPDPPGGLQEAIRQICLATSRVNVQNTIFTLSPNNAPCEIEIDGVRVVRERSWIAPASCDIGGLAAFTSFSHLLKQSDIVHYFYPWPFADALNLLKTTNQPTLLTYISDVVRQKFLGRLYEPLMWHTLSKMDMIISNCPSYVYTSPILSQKNIRDKVRIIPLGIDERTYPKIGNDSVFERIHVLHNEPYFLFLGVLRYYKGLHILIAAAKGINAKVIIAGSGPEGDNIKKQANELGLENVLFAGQVTDEEKVSLIKNCTALVLPSHLRSEAFGMVLVEASMFGKPMISCEIGTGTSYVNLHDSTGLVVSPNRVDELHEAMKTLLNDNNLNARYGRNARLRYENLFSGEALGLAYKAVYDELLK